MDQLSNGIGNEIVDTNKENLTSSVLHNDSTIAKIKTLNRFANVRQTLTSLSRNQKKITATNSVFGKEESLGDGAKLRLTTKTIDSSDSTENLQISTDSNKSSLSNVKSAVSKTIGTTGPRKSIKTPKRVSSTLTVNPLLKVHPSKPKKRKSTQPIDETGVTGSSKSIFAKPSNKFSCNSCEKSFFFKTTLVTHQKSHTAVNTCQHCKREFALHNALFIHLRHNCSKISFAERKKLLADDEKTIDLNRTSHKTPNLKLKQSTDELLDFVSKSCSSSQSNRLKAPMQSFPPIKGVYRTPKKLIKCIYCGDNFSNAFLFATHAEICAAGEAMGDQ